MSQNDKNGNGDHCHSGGKNVDFLIFRCPGLVRRLLGLTPALGLRLLLGLLLCGPLAAAPCHGGAVGICAQPLQTLGGLRQLLHIGGALRRLDPFLVVRLPAGAAAAIALFRLSGRLAQVGLIPGLQVLLCQLLRLLGRLHPERKGGKQGLLLLGQILRHRTHRELFRPGELLVLGPVVLRVLILPLPPRHLRIIGEVEGIEPPDLVLAHIAGQRILLYHFRNMGLVRR